MLRFWSKVMVFFCYKCFYFRSIFWFLVDFLKINYEILSDLSCLLGLILKGER